MGGSGRPKNLNEFPGRWGGVRKKKIPSVGDWYG